MRQEEETTQPQRQRSERWATSQGLLEPPEAGRDTEGILPYSRSTGPLASSVLAQLRSFAPRMAVVVLSLVYFLNIVLKYIANSAYMCTEWILRN